MDRPVKARLPAEAQRWRVVARFLPSALSLFRAALAPVFVVALMLVDAGPLGPARVSVARSIDPTSASALGVVTPGAGHLPLLCAAVAALTDFLDGKLARALGAVTPGGAALDVAADGIFVVTALVALAARGLVSWWVSIAASAALAGFALSRRHAAELTTPTAARGVADRAGHLAGIINYALILLASAVPLGWVGARPLGPASVAVAALNLAPLALRSWRAPRPRVPPAAGTRHRSAR